MAAHWTTPYLGLPWVLGESDCASLAIRIQREVFGKGIDLPAERACGVRGWNAQINDLHADYAEAINDPEEGAAALISIRGRFSHIGTVALIGGEPWILHTTAANGAVLQRARELPRYNMSIEGWYRWK